MNLLSQVLTTAIIPALRLLPNRMGAPEARVMLLAIGLQESRLTHRYQVVDGSPGSKGPARGLWQFEEAGGVKGVIAHPATRQHAEWVCKARGVRFDRRVVHRRLEKDDILAAAFARLLLLSDPRPLPSLTASHEEAWAYYIRNWRPGKPHRHTWDEFHNQAINFINEGN
jgi:hypothetical protein